MLILAADPDLVRRQLVGEDLDLADGHRLRAEISTDEITPVPSLVHFDATLSHHAHIGFRAGDETPIGPGALAAGRFSVLVGGGRYGKGSSREHAPLAERLAGIRLVIAESFERIYRQNADNLGLFTATDLGLVARVQAGEAVTVDELVADRDPLAAAILRAGGLLAYGRAELAGARPVALPDDGRPRTLFEKIVRRHALATSSCPPVGAAGESGFVRADLRFIHDIYTGMARHLLAEAFGADLALHDPASILAFEDHYSYTHLSRAHRALMPFVREASRAHRAFVAEHGLAHHGTLAKGPGSEGISHALMAERYALPGQLVVGTDSHTPHAGALGCVAFGVGTTDIANAFVTGAVRFAMPESLRIDLTGTLPAGVGAKDVALHLLALPEIRAGLGVGRVFEFTGEAVAALSTDERATLTNMTAELGGFTGLVAPDAETLRFLRERRGAAPALEDWMRSDPGAAYVATITVDVAALSPMLARPGDPGNGIPLDALKEPVPIDTAYGGSCTAGKREDFDRYHEVLSWAAQNGLAVAPGVRLILQFGTLDVRRYCEARGYLAAFAAVGAEVMQPACGACANCGPGASEHRDQVTISAINRNFPGRSGPGQVWLASPATMAASAIAGRITGFSELKRGRRSSGPRPVTAPLPIGWMRSGGP
ncbi:3-isopropylmalate dehydratase [Methylobacterium nonmethylotrophicum]|uniref:3-isopropylmalate dehydratase n=1 Tax=Methylobacterium nonmethylotrophicum TaxID=1141884 RepID=A0A4Z0NWF2_9HYPH|nr:3-isopropylmalate dehydratase [Methylobacterium nonmethylotrophicum]